MRRKSKKIQVDYNAIIEAKMISKVQELVDKVRDKHLGMSMVMGDFPVPLDLDATKLVREVVASVKKETLSLDCGSITDGVDIEGAEIEVLTHCLSKGILPRQILVEFDELRVPSDKGFKRATKMDELLIKNGYKMLKTDGEADFLYYRD